MESALVGSVLSPELCSEARTLLDLDGGELAFAALLDPSALAEFESGVRPLPPRKLAAVRRVLERCGVEFVPEDQRRGVRLRDYEARR
jgi:hypothetical protein